MKIVALAGGVGGAKLVEGLASILPAGDLTVIVNTGDDFNHLGLHICPDLDTVCYTLAGLANPTTGWGRKVETWNGLRAIKELGGPGWFNLGDGDIGTHLVRTQRMKSGESLSSIVKVFCDCWGVKTAVLPMSDDDVKTKIITDKDECLDFQEYFVRYQCQPIVKKILFEGARNALPAPGVLQSINAASWVIICPSNPWVSVDPILSIPGIAETVKGKNVVAVSPIVGGKTLKGPAAKMYQEFGISPSPLAVACHYEGIIKGFIFDKTDGDFDEEILKLGICTHITNTIMTDHVTKKGFAKEVIDFCIRLEKSFAE